jgi:hypothetical protein
MSTIEEFQEKFQTLLDLMKEKLNSTPKATSDQLEQLEFEYGNQHLSNSQLNSLIIDSIQMKPNSEEKFQMFQSLSQDAKIVNVLVFEMRLLEGYGHSDFRPADHQQSLEESENFLKRLKQNL